MKRSKERDFDFFQAIVMKSYRLTGKFDRRIDFVELPVSATCPDERCLKMAHKEAPWSVRLREFNIIRNFVADNGLRSGFEVATGFGISALAAALGMDAHDGGSLISLDSYAEERSGTWDGYKDWKHDRILGNFPGLRVAKWLAKEYCVDDIISFRRGWSPEDIPSICKGKKFDYVFIDGGHFDDQLIEDLRAIKPYLAEKHAIFLHDLHAFAPATLDLIEIEFGEPVVFEETIYPKGFHLALINNL